MWDLRPQGIFSHPPWLRHGLGLIRLTGAQLNYTLVQTSLECLPRAYLNSLAAVKPGRSHTIQTSRLLPDFKKLLKTFISDFTVLLSWTWSTNATSAYTTASILAKGDEYTSFPKCELHPVSDSTTLPTLPICPQPYRSLQIALKQLRMAVSTREMAFLCLQHSLPCQKCQALPPVWLITLLVLLCQ